MKFFILAFSLWIALAADAVAQTPQAAGGKSRAEVRADTEIWKESGLAALDMAGEKTPDPTTQEYRAAKARYEALRQSPQFAERVKKYEQ
jgi:hypothetical protein